MEIIKCKVFGLGLPRLLAKQLFLQSIPEVEISLSDENIKLKGCCDECRVTYSYTWDDEYYDSQYLCDLYCNVCAKELYISS